MPHILLSPFYLWHIPSTSCKLHDNGMNHSLTATATRNNGNPVRCLNSFSPCRFYLEASYWFPPQNGRCHCLFVSLKNWAIQTVVGLLCPLLWNIFFILIKLIFCAQLEIRTLLCKRKFCLFTDEHIDHIHQEHVAFQMLMNYNSQLPYPLDMLAWVDGRVQQQLEGHKFTTLIYTALSSLEKTTIMIWWCGVHSSPTLL